MLILYRKDQDTVDGLNTDAIATLSYTPEHQAAKYDEDDPDAPATLVTIPAALTLELLITESSLEVGYGGEIIGIRQDPVEMRLRGTVATDVYEKLRGLLINEPN